MNYPKNNKTKRREVKMEIIENSKVKEKLYIEKLENGLTVMIIPKNNTAKKYIIWAMICSLGIGAVFSSCSDYLSVEKFFEDRQNEDKIFKSNN